MLFFIESIAFFIIRKSRMNVSHVASMLVTCGIWVSHLWLLSVSYVASEHLTCGFLQLHQRQKKNAQMHQENGT